MSRFFWSNPWFMIPVLLFLNTGLVLLLLVPYGNEIVYLNTWRTEPLNSVFRFFTFLGEAPVFVGIGLIALLYRYRYALLIAGAGLFIVPISYYTKHHAGIDRPITYFEKKGMREAVVLVPGVELNGGQTSFPSGHTMTAFGMYALLSLMAGRQAPWMGLACAWTAMLVGISRIFLVQHFLVDVLGGAVVGLFIAWLVWVLNVRLLGKYTFLSKGLLRLPV